MTQAIDETIQQRTEVKHSTYEFPLNERIRTLLRLEDLFNRFKFFAQRDHKLDHHSALLALFEIIEVGSRSDLRTDLIQELERQKQTLAQLKDHPGVDSELLHETLSGLKRAIKGLSETSGRLGHHLRDNEFLMILRSRCSIPGGTCEFDLPSYHRWQSMNAASRRADIDKWFAPMAPLADSIHMVLNILRNTGETTTGESDKGSFTLQMSGKSFQLLRMEMPPRLDVVPEFSANKYMLWIRFNKPDHNGVCKNNPIEDSIQFKLKFCNL